MEAETRFQLVAQHSAWEAAIRELLSAPGSVATAPVRQNRTSRCTELLIGQMRVTDGVPHGGDYPAGTDWAVLLHAAGTSSVALRDLIPRFRPTAAQWLVVAVIGIGADQTGWDGAVVHGREHLPLAAIRIVGPGMVCASRQLDEVPGDYGPEAQERWSRARGALGDGVWRQVRRAQVAVVGASRTGSNLAFLLAALGVPGLLLCDPDRLETHNLDAMPGLTERDVGKPKVEALAKRLVHFRSDLFVQGLACSAADHRFVDRASGADLLVTCVDSDTPRLAATLLANRWLKVHLDIGTGVNHAAGGTRVIAADIRLLVPGQGCVGCVGGLADEDRARYDLLAPPGSLLRRRGPWESERGGSLVTVNMIAVSFGVQLWLDLLAGHLRGSHWTRLRWDAGQGLNVQAGDVSGRPDCRICGRNISRLASQH